MKFKYKMARDAYDEIVTIATIMQENVNKNIDATKMLDSPTLLRMTQSMVDSANNATARAIEVAAKIDIDMMRLELERPPRGLRRPE